MKIRLDRFYRMDCLDYLRSLPDCSVDLIVTDPPYGVSYAGNRFFDDSLAYIIAHIDEWLQEMQRVLKPGCHIYIYIPTLHIDLFITAMKKHFKFINLLAARAKTSYKQPLGSWKYDVQFIAHGSKGKAKRLNRVDIQKKCDAWLNDPRNKSPNPYSYHYSSFLDDRANAEVKNHPNAKNVEQIKKLILLSSNEGEVVLDTFAGGGSVAVAAKATGRHFYTCDLVDYGVEKRLKEAA
ncbi:DNA methylase [Spirochaetota bacterium]